MFHTSLVAVPEVTATGQAETALPEAVTSPTGTVCQESVSPRRYCQVAPV
ncbi:hypothetical protein [Streptomyces lutosisoli]|uniref:Uncharacterized protein n=1 Tax=Streptomyces lutosisoli TaxID=2665721 RepID=A0ABW2VJ74_9ACTN